MRLFSAPGMKHQKPKTTHRSHKLQFLILSRGPIAVFGDEGALVESSGAGGRPKVQASPGQPLKSSRSGQENKARMTLLITPAGADLVTWHPF